MYRRSKLVPLMISGLLSVPAARYWPVIGPLLAAGSEPHMHSQPSLT